MADVWREERMLIAGDLVDSYDGATFENRNPATEQVLGVVADGGPAEMDAAISSARTAFDHTDWSTNLELRVRSLRQLRESLAKHAEDLRATVVAEVGCPVSLTYGPQMDLPIAGLEWVANVAENYQWVTDLGIAEPFGVRTQRYCQREPVGVVAAITPWNYPVQINLAKVGPALAAGNTVVLKPAPDTPWTATLLGRLVAEETDIPAGVFNVVTSSRHEVGAQLSGDARVDMVSFTGSTATGRAVMRSAAANITKVFLELGGKSALIMLDDGDLQSAVGSAVAAITTHAGQGCAINSRLILPRARYDEGVAMAVELLRTKKYGDPTDPANLMGPLISEQQRQRVLGYVQRGIDEGATVAFGGGVPAHLPTGFYVEPTILTNVQPSATVAQEEIFGPVLVVLAHDGDDDAVAIANDSVYGLAGAVLSASKDRARRVANRVRAGAMSVNRGIFYGADVPFGGYRHSGIGRESGVAGFEEYLETKTVAEGL